MSVFGRNEIVAATALAGTLCALAVPASAQEADPEQEVFASGAIIVTAQKREQAIVDVPLSITTFSKDDLDNLRVNDFGDYARLTPNISFNNPSGDRSDVRFSIRGVGPISSGGAGNSVGIYIDEFNIAPNILARTVDTELQDAARIEVLRGPQGTFFGRNTVGGAISITSVKPQTGEFSGYAEAGYSSFDTFRLESGLNIPVGANVAARVLGYYDRSDGFLIQEGPFGAGNESENYGGRLALRFEPAVGTTIDLSGYYSNQKQTLPSFVPSGFLSDGVQLLTDLVSGIAGQRLGIRDLAQIVGAADPLPDGTFPENSRTINTDIGQPSENETYTIIGRLEHELSDSATLTIVGGYINNNYFTSGEGDFTSNPSFTITRTTDFEAWSGEARLSGRAGRLNYLVGAFYGQDKVTSFNSSTKLASDPFTRNPIPGVGLGAYDLAFLCIGGQSGISGCPSTAVPGFRRFIPGVNSSTGLFENVTFGSDTESFAAFFDATYELTSRFEISLGGRYTNETVGGFRNEGPLADPFAPRVGNPSTEANFDDFSPRIAALFRVSDAVNIYASASRGFRSGGANPVADDPSTPVDESIFDKESIWNYEIGAKMSALQGRVYASIAFFRMDWSDIQIRAQDPITQRQIIQNAPGATNQGFEAEIAVVPLTGLSLRLNAGYIDAKFGQFPNARTLDGEVIDATGRRLPNSPAITTSSIVRYERPVTKTFKGFLQGEASFIDEQQTDIADNARRSLDAYTLVNLRAGLTSPNFDLQLFVENLFDEVYRLGVNNLETYLSGAQSTIGEPRRYGVQATFRF